MLEQFRSATSNEHAPHSAFAPLTDRELEILRKVSDGLTNAEIGYALGISAQTVKNHVTSILRKLAVNDRTQAVVTALKRGWLSIDDTNPRRTQWRQHRRGLRSRSSALVRTTRIKPNEPVRQDCRPVLVVCRMTGMQAAPESQGWTDHPRSTV